MFEDAGGCVLSGLWMFDSFKVFDEEERLFYRCFIEFTVFGYFFNWYLFRVLQRRGLKYQL